MARRALLVVLVALASACLVCWNLREDSPTEDEWAHLVRGIAFWQEKKDTSIYVQHPPLGDALAGVPAIFDHATPRISTLPRWQTGYAPAGDYIAIDYAHARKQLQQARYAMLVYPIALAIYVFFWCESWFGFPTALAALLLVAFNPTLIAQARYVTTDMPIATASFFAIGEFIRYLRGKTRSALFTAPLALAWAVLAKHSGLLWVPIFFAIGFGLALAQKARFAELPRRDAAATFAAHALVTGLFLIFSINAAYKFDRSGFTVAQILAAPEPVHWTSKQYRDRMLEERSLLPKLPQRMRIPLPYTYVFALASIQEHNRRGYPTYFFGSVSKTGKLLYFPTLLAIKNQPALLLFGGLGLALWLRRRPLRVSLASGVLLVASSLFLLSAMRSNLNMGVRHVLPLVPPLCVLGARGFALAWAAGRTTIAQALLGLGLLSSPASAVLAGPDFLGYFNFLCGGRRGGHQISVVGEDWGQDRKRLADYARAKRLQPFYYYPETITRKREFDFFEVPYSELECRRSPPPGAYAAVHLQALLVNPGPSCFPWAHGLEPIAKINDHVLIFKLPELR